MLQRTPGYQFRDPKTGEYYDPQSGQWWDPHTRKYYSKPGGVVPLGFPPPSAPPGRSEFEVDEATVKGSKGKSGWRSMLKKWATGTAPDHQTKAITAQLVFATGSASRAGGKGPQFAGECLVVWNSNKSDV
jgi:hypothetical protein